MADNDTQLTYGDMLDVVARIMPDTLAVSSDKGDFTWRAFDERTNALARGLSSLGARPGDKICFLLANGSPFLELLAACFKGRFIHVNANYRYQAKELEYILENSDSDVLVYDPRFASQVLDIRPELLARLKLVQSGGQAADLRNDALLEDLISAHSGEPLQVKRSPDDLMFIYTGGTTGMPKGVMWQQKEQIKGLLAGRLSGGVLPTTIEQFHQHLEQPRPFSRVLVAAPLMHAAGMYSAINTLFHGGHVIVTDNAEQFDAGRHWQLIDKYQADALGLIGDPFAKPLLEALRTGQFDGSSLRLIASSGALWSKSVKRGFLECLPQLTLYDSLGSSEAQSFGVSMMTADSETTTSEFRIGDDCRVVDDAGVSIASGSGETGMLVRDGAKPLGYYKDKEKTAALFVEIEGRQFIKTGDMCTVDKDGTVRLLGRGSQCINTGGEKVFPGEVEAALVTHDHVYDALVFGRDDPQWGQAVQAVVHTKPDAVVTSEELRGFLRNLVARYKVPKQIVLTDQSLRQANGKPDYGLAKEVFEKAIV